ncbi:MAG: right-handed parallel beta-helix repeat-containing protein [Clostridia bacterium]|nr:right-handed parallel beta-helix repeat-containing protein [Clostridia bacterium]
MVKMRSVWQMRLTRILLLVFAMSVSPVLADNTASKALDEAGGFSVGDIVVMRADGTKTHSFEEGALSEVMLTKKNLPAASGRFITAVFDDDILLSACLTDVDFSAGEQAVTVDTALPLGQNIRSQTVKAFLWDNNMSPMMNCFAYNASSDTWQYGWSAVYNGQAAEFDVPPSVSGTVVYLPAKNIINKMGMALEEYNGVYTAEREDGRKLEFSLGSCTAMADGTETELDGAPYLDDNAVVMVPCGMLTSFGADVEVNDIKKTVTITYSYTAPEYPKPSKAGIGITYTPGINYADYDIACGNADTRIEVWYKDAYSSDVRRLYWQKCADAVYSDGHFRGGISGLSAGRTYHVKYRITNSGTSNIYVQKSAFKTAAAENPGYSEFLAGQQSGGSAVLVPTYENISYYASYTPPEEDCDVFYRKKGDTDWKKAFAPYRDETGVQYRGSITNLEEDTEYCVKLEYKDANGMTVRTIGGDGDVCTRTWSSMPHIGRTINVSEIYRPGQQLMLTNLHGSDDSWIRINGDVSIDAGSNYYEAVAVNNCTNIILDGLTVKGGYRYGICVNGNCSDVRIINCDISEWGRRGVLDADGVYRRIDGEDINYDGGITLLDARRVTVERCYIHDSNASANAWYGNWDGMKHPKGPTGIYYNALEACVFRYNDIIGSDASRWNDGIEGRDNGYYTGGAARDTDIYGNAVMLGNDDGLEADGGQMNARIYGNRFEQMFCAVSLAPNMAGPSYVFRNLVSNMGCSYNNMVGRALKVGGGAPGEVYGKSYIINNTIDIPAPSVENVSFGSYTAFCADTYNNIFISRDSGRSAFKNSLVDKINSYHRDIVYGGTKNYKEYAADSIYSVLPQYVNREKGDYAVKDGAAYRSGVRIDNFLEDTSPNIGAMQESDRYMPLRPIDMKADVYHAQMQSGGEVTVTVTLGNIGDGRSYTLHKSKDMNWLEIVDGTGAEAVPNSEVKLRLRANLPGGAENTAEGVVLFRLDNGYSIPISVSCGK